jgi:hypothetical protein
MSGLNIQMPEKLMVCVQIQRTKYVRPDYVSLFGCTLRYENIILPLMNMSSACTHNTVLCNIAAFSSCSRQAKFCMFLGLMVINHTDCMLIISRFKTAFLNFFDLRVKLQVSPYQLQLNFYFKLPDLVPEKHYI